MASRVLNVKSRRAPEDVPLTELVKAKTVCVNLPGMALPAVFSNVLLVAPEWVSVMRKTTSTHANVRRIERVRVVNSRKSIATVTERQYTRRDRNLDASAIRDTALNRTVPTNLVV